MKYLKVIYSPTIPRQKDTIWAKPVDGGFALYMLVGREWKPLRLIDVGETASISDDLVVDIEQKRIGAFDVSTRSSKEGVTAEQTTAFSAAVKSAATVDMYGLLSEGTLYFEFHGVTTDGNLEVRNVKFSAELAVSVTDDVTPAVVVSDVTITKAHPYYKNAALSDMLETLVESISASTVSAVLVTEEE